MLHNQFKKLGTTFNYYEKIKLQDLGFPDGIPFDRENDNYRTIEVNAILELTHSFTNTFMENKNGQTRKFSDLSAWVALVGIEPTS